MARKIKEFVQIDAKSLDGLIEALVKVREALPDEAGAELKLRGCDVFGRHIAVSYMRPQTDDEAACEARYDEAARQTMQQRDRDRAAEASRSGYGHLRAVA